ncbi:MAG TPA: hypothetical protein VFK85_04500 [Anaeromyxobacteraceae bacterium]|nr:hypothetical protein [Anaeromyxobacteraceae bacterium]
MRKAFDANVPKLKPRLRGATVQVTEEPTATGEVEAAPDIAVIEEEISPTAALAGAAQAVEPEPAAAPVAVQAPAPAVREVPVAPVEPVQPVARIEPEPVRAPPPAPVERVEARAQHEEVIFADASDVLARRERLLEVKRRVEDAVRPRPRAEPAPERPAKAGESAIALVRELESQLARAREVETALRADLEDARTEVARGAADVRRVTERLTAAEVEVQSKRDVLAELLEEMKALEQERDRAMERAQALATLDEERQEILDSLSTRAEDAEKARAAAEAEIERLGTELDERSADGARLRAALAMVTRERDDLAREAATAKREKEELEEARRALEAVHDALSQARTRLG